MQFKQDHSKVKYRIWFLSKIPGANDYLVITVLNALPNTNDNASILHILHSDVSVLGIDTRFSLK